eukprot:NODE_82_length_2547_cov_290.341473_g63_i0.p1 GENE.NODE_82_length_2547_cov_290.341473_g63_i0~~NODE_82_length_2547_cov_290.341473_g63_i0.p1  ORF type:complete len:764 (+),score=160.34 NODE_82_length_2547_cov_290.341473_g63_i0:70-2361(+)
MEEEDVYLQRSGLLELMNDLALDVCAARPSNVVDYLQQWTMEREQQAMQDSFCKLQLGINVNVKVELKVTDTVTSRPQYQIVGPPNVVQRLKQAGSQGMGSMSPLTSASLDALLRCIQFVPSGATQFAYAHPPANATWAEGEFEENDAGLSFLRCGGFVFFDAMRAVLQVNGLTLSTERALVFDGPFKAAGSVVDALRGCGRLQPATSSEARMSGADCVAWVNPGEFAECLAAPFGGLLFTFSDPKLLNRYFRLTAALCMKFASRRGRMPWIKYQQIEETVNNAAGFDSGYPVQSPCGRGFSLQNAVPYQLRLATALLTALGRDKSDIGQCIKSGAGHWEFTPEETNVLGLRPVHLLRPLKQFTGELVFSADRAEQWLREWYGTDTVTGMLREVGVQGLGDIFGPGVAKFSSLELRGFEQSTNVLTGLLVPAEFYRRLLPATTTHVQTTFDNKALTLRELVDKEVKSGNAAESALQTLLREADRNYAEFGFASEAAKNQTFQNSLSELSTGVLISGEGRFLVENYNQIASAPPNQQSILFLSIAAPDFDEPDRNPAARREEAKYFTVHRDANGKADHGEWKEGAQEALKQRLKQTYHLIYTACQRAGVNYPEFVPMGLGAFLPRFRATDVKRIYCAAQFELLSTRDYGFDTVFLNPGPATFEARALLRDGDYNFHCNLVLHPKNGKFLAIELARNGLRTCVLNPSDCISLMAGCLGYWWEVGRGSRYAGEEDIAATSTILLSRWNISDAYLTRVQQVEGPEVL